MVYKGDYDKSYGPAYTIKRRRGSKGGNIFGLARSKVVESGHKLASLSHNIIQSSFVRGIT